MEKREDAGEFSKSGGREKEKRGVNKGKVQKRKNCVRKVVQDKKVGTAPSPSTSSELTKKMWGGGGGGG